VTLCSVFMPCRISLSSVPQICTNRFIGIDFVQERFMGQGKQDNESAIEQAKDGQIADFIRGQYKGATGSDFPIGDKKNSFN
jgi:ERCC4-related helicase